MGNMVVCGDPRSVKCPKGTSNCDADQIDAIMMGVAIVLAFSLEREDECARKIQKFDVVFRCGLVLVFGVRNAPRCSAVARLDVRKGTGVQCLVRVYAAPPPSRSAGEARWLTGHARFRVWLVPTPLQRSLPLNRPKALSNWPSPSHGNFHIPL